MHNVAIQKLSNEANKIFSECYEDSLSHISGESCYSDFIKLPSNLKNILVNKLEQRLSKDQKKFSSKENISLWFDIVYKYQLKQIDYEYLKDDFVLIHIFLTKKRYRSFKQSINDYALIVFCSLVSNNTYLDDVHQCIDHETDEYTKSPVVLVSSLYSKPMNYLLNIIWGHFDINLENSKLLIEISKFLMIIGCASNFLIYIAMSEKLRDAMKKMFKCRENQKIHEVEIEMQIKG
ncbi:unnamed protein product [Mytilus coruscus]|uniref:Uncharacterized protein n=1 Tax=Mytilus coruscus TaxID=42192 RepID=A0A6J8C591_MYTCO|nr:unnamed protein product [Mytilus coruscus]